MPGTVGPEPVRGMKFSAPVTTGMRGESVLRIIFQFWCNKFYGTKQDWSNHKGACKSAETTAIPSPPPQNVFHLREVETATDSTSTKCPPEPEMFPAQLRDFQYRCSPDGVDENLLILLHGRGDTHTNFVSFAEKLNLPQCAYLALSGPIRLPESVVTGRLWLRVYDYDNDWAELRRGDAERAESLKTTQILLEDVIQVMCKGCGWRRSRIFLLGYGDGGMVALELAMGSCGQNRLGGVISISGPVFPEYSTKGNLRSVECQRGCTPVLITYGTIACEQHLMDIERSKRCLDMWHGCPQAEVVGVSKEEEMVKTAEEATVLHRFFADHLSRRMINMEKNSTLYEVTTS
ncbi:hypothetical protein R1flu_003684 [Riccia fluitans]|uniref:Phospholipase/carboxylesterase/thioesterase domain-containing protein n=1 Tax=Riccia fluitans TaxID=41844 RepID=A0ABD1YDC5_9MARC